MRNGASTSALPFQLHLPLLAVPFRVQLLEQQPTADEAERAVNFCGNVPLLGYAAVCRCCFAPDGGWAGVIRGCFWTEVCSAVT
jgi:hypothetical protein